MNDGQQFYTGLKLGASGKVVAKLDFKDMGTWGVTHGHGWDIFCYRSARANLAMWW